MVALVIAFRRILRELVSGIKTVLTLVLTLFLDLLFAAYNLLTPDRPAGRVVPQGHPGRCSCPALNALANHGVLPRDGKSIKFTEVTDAVCRVYNLSPTLSFLLGDFIAGSLVRNFRTDRLDLADIDVHNCIEHDASLTRVDHFHDPDQDKIAHEGIDGVLASGTGPGGNLTPPDIARLLGKRRVEAKTRNPKFSLALIHKLFGSANGTMLLTIFGGRVDDLRSFLGEERLPDGWESRIRHRMGMTAFEFNFKVFSVELSIKEEVDDSIARAGQERYLRAGEAESRKNA
ncbi:heme-thiolate peroxidase [Trametes cubensis]|uniref:Heme-thiolate peroxidase n=1 Tax=Trametes cubensis TaxID=1111947 RepID=A0AAD7TUB3_9APHY|nr:heme-thiolate peroxidase [Trametes cubensis]